MLKYRINSSDFNKTNVRLSVNSIEFTDFSSDIEGYDGANSDKVMVVCDCNSLNGLTKGMIVQCNTIMILNYTTKVEDYKFDDGFDEGLTHETYELVQSQETFTFNNEYKVLGLNENEVSFSFMTDKKFTLDVDRIVKYVYPVLNEDDNREEVMIYFNGAHYFDVDDDDITISFIYSKPYKSKVEEEKEFEIELDDEETVNNSEGFIRQTIVLPCILSDKETLSIDLKKLDKKQKDFLNGLFSEMESYKQYPINANLTGIEVFRDNFLFGDKTEYEFVFEKPTVTISLPLSNSFETNLFQSELLNEYFVEDEKKKAINKIVDIEKDVYYPCICEYKNDPDSANDYSLVSDAYTIKFNLHFREHIGDDWLVDNNSLWNGVKSHLEKNSDDMNISKIDGLNEKVSQDSASDLLTFLGFTNEDVHYQKNKLKKSFLRLSYYDSPDPTNQNMFGYSTIFFDTGDMFARYIKYMDEGDYTQIIRKDIGDYVLNEKKVGIRVDREHGFKDEFRLSSQFVVKSKNTSNTSSEGFYIYIWKDNESTIPQDLYMKVEFNHAGYGRTIPFMLPFYDHKKHGGTQGHIKSFKEILEDFDGKNDGPYGMKQYMKYSYIHLKYYYDKEKQIHRYFIDPETYGENCHDMNKTEDISDNTITINLYEAKIG